jgi:hypothetical protein
LEQRGIGLAILLIIAIVIVAVAAIGVYYFVRISGNRVIFKEDFNYPDGTVLPAIIDNAKTYGGYWVILNGEVDIASGIDAEAWWGDYTGDLDLEASCELIEHVPENQPESAFNIYFRGTDRSHAYLFGFDFGGILRIARNEGPGWVTLASESYLPVLNKWYHLKVTLRGSNIKAYLDDELTFDINDNFYTSGIIGLAVANGAVRFDNVIVTVP